MQLHQNTKADSPIKAYGFSKSTNTLRIVFASGAWDYPASFGLFAALHRAPSKGAFFHNRIRTKIAGTKVSA